jgi:protein-L-isoaspartate(D-aspartate) O-methyltransferase
MVEQVRDYARLIHRLHGVPGIEGQVLDVMARVPRHRFVPVPLRPLAYLDRPLPVGQGQNIAQPYIIALMTSLARIGPGDVVFETGTGAGYHAAVLAELADRVYSVEVIEPLAMRAARLLGDMGYANVETHIGDGYFGWLKQLKPGGRLIAPIGPLHDTQNLTLVEKGTNGDLKTTNVLEVRFSPLQGGERI